MNLNTPMDASAKFPPTEQSATATMLEHRIRDLAAAAEEKRRAEDRARLISFDELGPQPWGASIQMLPGKMVLLNPTEMESKLINIFVTELNRIKPPELVAEVQSEEPALTRPGTFGGNTKVCDKCLLIHPITEPCRPLGEVKS